VNRSAVVLLLLSGVLLVGGVASFSPRIAVLVAAVMVFLVGLSQLEVKGRTR
jgi:hypothetical protein